MQEKRSARSENALDWVASVFPLIGAFARGFFVTGVNLFDVALKTVWDPLDDLAFIFVFLSGLWWIYRACAGR